MLVVKITSHLPNAFAVFLSEGVPIGVADNFQSCFVSDLKPVTFQWRRQILICYRNILVSSFRQLRLRRERPVAIDGNSWE